MRDCTDSLLNSWGYDATLRSSIAKSPSLTASTKEWGNEIKYPFAELASGGRAIVNFRLDLDSMGTPTKCEILKSPSNEAFNKSVCDIAIKKARYSPALDKDGKAVAWYHIQSIIFFMDGNRFRRLGDTRY